MEPVAVLGLGLVGGSVARRLAAQGVAVRAYDVDAGTRRAAADEVPVAMSVRAAVDGAGLVVVAVPLPAIDAVLAELSGHPGVVTDVVSVKAPVLTSARGRVARFVGGHPMAGTERSGWAAADPGLFAERVWVLSLEPDTGLADWLAVARLVTGALGAVVVPATAAEHDEAVARVSHLPHLVAAALAAPLAPAGAAHSGAAAPGAALAAALAAGSFRDGTRVAATRPELVAAMCAGNRDALLAALDSFTADLAAARAALTGGSADLTRWLRTGHAGRTGWPPPLGAPSVEPATASALLSLGRAGGRVLTVGDDGTVIVARPADP